MTSFHVTAFYSGSLTSPHVHTHSFLHASLRLFVLPFLFLLCVLVLLIIFSARLDSSDVLFLFFCCFFAAFVIAFDVDIHEVQYFVIYFIYISFFLAFYSVFYIFRGFTQLPQCSFLSYFQEQIFSHFLSLLFSYDSYSVPHSSIIIISPYSQARTKSVISLSFIAY